MKKLNMGGHNDTRVSAIVDKTQDVFRQAYIEFQRSTTTATGGRRQHDWPTLSSPSIARAGPTSLLGTRL